MRLGLRGRHPHPPAPSPASGRGGGAREHAGVWGTFGKPAGEGEDYSVGGAFRRPRLCEGIAIEFLVRKSHAGDEVLIGSQVGRCCQRKLTNARDYIVLIDPVAGDTEATDK